MNPHPEPGVVADVVLDGGWRRNVTVIGGADPVLLRPIEGPATLPGTLTWCPACLEWRDGHRAARLNGMLTHAAEGFALTPIGSGRTLQRRRFVRVAAEVPAALVAHDQRVIARTINLSLGGMLVADAADLRIDEPLQFALDVGSDTVSGVGRVVRGSTDGSRGVAFAGLDSRAERLLARFVSERQRQLAAA